MLAPVRQAASSDRAGSPGRQQLNVRHLPANVATSAMFLSGVSARVRKGALLQVCSKAPYANLLNFSPRAQLPRIPRAGKPLPETRCARHC